MPLLAAPCLTSAAHSLEEYTCKRIERACVCRASVERAGSLRRDGRNRREARGGGGGGKGADPVTSGEILKTCPQIITHLCSINRYIDIEDIDRYRRHVR
jgi:hypothetical protein